MQYNNKNVAIANKLEVISQQIVDTEKNNIDQAIAEIQQAYNEIEILAQDKEIPILRVIAHWMALNTEIDSENTDQIRILLENNSYSNWMDVLASLLHKHEPKLLPIIHNNLTSPSWIVKPSAPLLTGLASWLAIIKIENEKNNQLNAQEDESSDDTTIFNVNKSDEKMPQFIKIADEIEIHTEEDFEVDIIGDQIAKAKEANEESLIQQTVFAEIDLDLLEKDYSSSDVVSEFLETEVESNDLQIPLIESEKSSLDDDNFELKNLVDSSLDMSFIDNDVLEIDETETTTNEKLDFKVDIDNGLLAENDKLIESLLSEETFDDRVTVNEVNNDATLTINTEISEIETEQDFDININADSDTDIQYNDASFVNELNSIHQKLNAIMVPSTDIYSVKSQFIKELDHLVLLTNDSPLKSIGPISEWCQHNLSLFEDNTTSKIEKFIKSGKAWSWIEQLHSCVNGVDNRNCLTDLTDALTQEEWLEPVDTAELEALLVSVKVIIDDEHEDETSIAESTSDESILVVEANAENEEEYPELIDIAQFVDASAEDDQQETTTSSETSGFQMNWDDDTHPELLMVYLEETPTQIEQLQSLLVLVSNAQADAEQKQTASRLAHTIKGGSAVVGITTLAEFAYRLETILDHSKKHKISDKILALLPDTGKCLDSVFNAVQMQLSEPSEFLDLFKTLDSYVSTLDEDDELLELTTPELPDFILNQNEDNSDINSKDESIHDLVNVSTNENVVTSEKVEAQDIGHSIDVKSEDELGSATETVTIKSETSGFQINWDDDTHPELLMVYLEETPTQINELVPLMQKISEGTADSDEKHIASRMAHTIKGASAIVGITALSEFAYRLETLLDHSVKFKLPDEILTLLPSAAACVEETFDAVQMQDEEPTEYFAIFKQLDEFVNNIEESDELLELSAPVLPDFILNQNISSDENSNTEELISEEKSAEIIVNEETDNEIDHQIEALLGTDTDVNTENEATKYFEVAETNEDSIVSEKVEISENAQAKNTDDSDEKTEELTTDASELEKLESPEDVENIIVEIDNIVMNLVTISGISESVKEGLEHYLTELQRFDLIADISGYPELSLLSQWCQSNLELFAQKHDDASFTFVSSGEVWSWIEFVGASLNEPDDMSNMSLLSAELMRDDWIKAIEMDDLQTVLLALRHIEESNIIADVGYVSSDNASNEIISWDKDVHPELLAVYFKETPDQINEVAELLHVIAKGESSTDENKKASRIAHTIKGASGVVGLNSLVDLTHSLEDILDYSVSHDIPSETADLLAEASDCMEGLFESIQNKQAEPEELPSVLERLSIFSESLASAIPVARDTIASNTYEAEDQYLPAVKTLTSDISDESFSTQKIAAKIDINEAYIRVPVTVIDKLINLAGELVTTSSQVGDNLANSLITNNIIRSQDERVHNMLSELTNTIVKQEKDQQHLLSSLENSDFDDLEMDTYNELHSIASLLSESILDSQEIDLTLNKQLNELSDKIRSLDKLNKDFSDVILSSRMVSINTIVPRLERIVRQTCRKTDKKAKLVVTGNNINIDTDILNGLVDPLLHMLRNSIDHGIESPAERVKNNKDETGLIELSFVRDGNNILMALKDDGAGIDPEVIYQKAIHKDMITPEQEFSKSETLKLILEPGFTTQENVTNISGRGVGMDVVNNSVGSLNGTLSIDSEISEGTEFSLTIPMTLITNTTLLVRTANNVVAIPTDIIEQIVYQEANQVIERDDAYFVLYEDQEVEIKSLSKLLSWADQKIDFTKSYNLLMVKADNDVYAVYIDSIISSREVVVKPLSPWVAATKGVVGACHLNDGGVAPVINLLSVVKQIQEVSESSTSTSEMREISNTGPAVLPKILVVDDSMSNRKALSLIIDKNKFDVITAVDGMDALRIMNENIIDLVFTDLEMPRMNGIELTQAIRAWNDKREMPIVMITSRTTSKHRELAEKAGVDDYLTKPVVTETLLESIDTWLVNNKSVNA